MVMEEQALAEPAAPAGTPWRWAALPLVGMLGPIGAMYLFGTLGGRESIPAGFGLCSVLWPALQAWALARWPLPPSGAGRALALGATGLGWLGWLFWAGIWGELS